MHSVLEQINQFKDKIKFIAENLNTVSDFIEERSMTQEEKYSIVEPYIEMLIASSSGEAIVAPVIKQEFKEIAEQLCKNNKIQAIKMFKAYFDSGLRVAKEEIERVYETNGSGWLVDRWEYNGELIWERKDI